MIGKLNRIKVRVGATCWLCSHSSSGWRPALNVFFFSGYLGKMFPTFRWKLETFREMEATVGESNVPEMFKTRTRTADV